MSRITAPIDVLADSTQAADVAASKGPTDTYHDLFRAKQYNKWWDVPPFSHPSDWEFPQPVQVVAERMGLPYDVADRTFLGQLSGCNLDCRYCYRGAAGSRSVTPAQYVNEFLCYNIEHRDAPAGVLRISGGEPMLYQGWVGQVVRLVGGEHYVWVDTNLTTSPSLGLTRELVGPNVSVNGCFKPGVVDDPWAQIELAKAMVGAGVDMYFYWPSDDGQDDYSLFADFLECLEESIPSAPLRLTVIHIKYSYDAVKEKNDDWEASDATSLEALHWRRDYWREFCAEQYPPWLCNTPSHRVKIG